MSSSEKRPSRSVKQPNRRQTGYKAEQLAEEYLLSHGYAVLARNVQEGHKELDLIAQHGKTIVFVEVKSSRGESFGHPAGWITAQKQARLVEAAQLYLQRMGMENQDVRFDVIAVVNGRVEHYPNAIEDCSEY